MLEMMAREKQSPTFGNESKSNFKYRTVVEEEEKFTNILIKDGQSVPITGRTSFNKNEVSIKKDREIFVEQDSSLVN